MTKSIADLSLENQENYDNLMKYLMNYAMFKYHIGVEFTDRLPPIAPPISYKKPGKLIIMNARWKYPTQIPFLLAHEIGHILDENAMYYHLNDLNTNKGEARENLFAINVLKQYCIENEFNFSSSILAKCFGIPQECYYLLDAYMAFPSPQHQ